MMRALAPKRAMIVAFAASSTLREGQRRCARSSDALPPAQSPSTGHRHADPHEPSGGHGGVPHGCAPLATADPAASFAPLKVPPSLRGDTTIDRLLDDAEEGISGTNAGAELFESDRADAAHRERKVPLALTADNTQVDPFRVGYNMGMQNVQLETLRNKLDDNRELIKSMLSSLRETTRTNHDALRRLHSEYNRQLLTELRDSNDRIATRLDTLTGRLLENEEAHMSQLRQQFEGSQKHADDRLENIKDTVKIASVILIVLNVCLLFLINGGASAQNGGRANVNNSAGPSSPQSGTGANATPAKK